MLIEIMNCWNTTATVLLQPGLKQSHSRPFITNNEKKGTAKGGIWWQWHSGVCWSGQLCYSGEFYRACWEISSLNLGFAIIKRTWELRNINKTWGLFLSHFFFSIISIINTFYLNPRSVWIGRNLKFRPVPPPAMIQGTFHYPSLLQAPSSLALNSHNLIFAQVQGCSSCKTQNIHPGHCGQGSLQGNP